MAVAVEKWVNGLELDVDQARSDEQRQIGPFVVQEKFEVIHAFGNRVRRWGHEGGVAGASTADPVLAPAEFTGLLIAPPALREEDSVDLPNQPERQRKAAAHAVESVVQRGDVVRDFFDVA